MQSAQHKRGAGTVGFSFLVRMLVLLRSVRALNAALVPGKECRNMAAVDRRDSNDGAAECYSRYIGIIRLSAGDWGMLDPGSVVAWVNLPACVLLITWCSYRARQPPYLA